MSTTSSSQQLPSPSLLVRPSSTAQVQQRDAAAPDEAEQPAGIISKKQTSGKLKKPRKARKPKSEEIIINSDDVDAGNAPTLPASISKELRAIETCPYFRETSPAPRQPLSELLGNFGYVSVDTPSTERQTLTAPMIKRRKIELADAATVSILGRKPSKAPATEMPPPKEKKRPKTAKKPQTITALATAAYQPLQEAKQDADVVSQCFAPQVEDVAVAQCSITTAETTAKPKKPRKPPVKKTQDGTAAPSAKKPPGTRKLKVTFKEHEHRQPLYSPEAASRQLQQQAFLFGTSSQLVVEESPTFIREIQTAINKSETMLSTQAATSPQKKSSARVPTAPHGTCLSIEQAGKELWCSAARNFDGGLIRDRKFDKPLPQQASKDLRTISDHAHDDLQPTARSLAKNDAEGDIAREAKEADMPLKHDQHDVVAASTKTKTSQADPIDLCSSSPRGSSPVVVARETKSLSLSPAYKMGKTASKVQQGPDSDDWHNVDAISDPDSPTTPSPPRKRSSASPPVVPALDFDITASPTNVTKAPALPVNGSIKPTDAQWPEMRELLFSQITAAVKGKPPSTDSAEPSWHEKILLYDPIVLEELTDWLNSQGLRVGVRRSRPKEKKRGRPKKDAVSEELFEVNDEELQPWMVQKWCEEKSICCGWKDGLRGGGRNRY